MSINHIKHIKSVAFRNASEYLKDLVGEEVDRLQGIPIMDADGNLLMVPQRGKEVLPSEHKDPLVYAFFRCMDLVVCGWNAPKSISSNPFWGILDLMMSMLRYHDRYWDLVAAGDKVSLIKAIRSVTDDMHHAYTLTEYAGVYGNSTAVFLEWVEYIAVTYLKLYSRNHNCFIGDMVAFTASFVVFKDRGLSKQCIDSLLDSKYGPDGENDLLDAVTFSKVSSIEELILVKEYSHMHYLSQCIANIFAQHDGITEQITNAHKYGQQPFFKVIPKALKNTFIDRCGDAALINDKYSLWDTRDLSIRELVEHCCNKDMSNEPWDESIPKEHSVIKLEERTLPSGNTVSLIPIGDKLHWSIGKITDCCQQRDRAAHSVCAHSFCSDRSEVIIVRDSDGEVLYMSWVWLNDNGDGLMLDSIEGRKVFSRGTMAKDWADIVSLLLEENKFVKEVRIGETSYGHTKTVRDMLKLTSTSTDLVWDLYPSSTYMDCGKRHALAGSQVPTEAPIPYVENVDSSKYSALVDEVVTKVMKAMSSGMDSNDMDLLAQYEEAYLGATTIGNDTDAYPDEYRKLYDVVTKIKGKPFGRSTPKILRILELGSAAVDTDGVQAFSDAVDEIIDHEGFIPLDLLSVDDNTMYDCEKLCLVHPDADTDEIPF